MKKVQNAFLALVLALSASADAQTLEVTSEPPGAMVVIDRQIRGRTPLVLTELKPGKHLLRVSHGEQFHPYSQEVRLEEGKTEVCHVLLAPLSQTSLQKGVELYRKGKDKEAEALLRRAVLDLPIQPQAYWWLGNIASAKDEWPEALELFRQYAQYFPKDSKVHLAMGEVHQRMGNQSAALTSYKLALLSQPEYADALQGVESATWEEIKQAGSPEGSREQLRLAHLLELKGKIPEALQWAERAALSAFPEHSRLPIR